MNMSAGLTTGVGSTGVRHQRTVKPASYIASNANDVGAKQ